MTIDTILFIVKCLIAGALIFVITKALLNKRKKTWEVLMGNPLGGHSTVGSGLSYEEAMKLVQELQQECDYSTTAIIQPE